MRAAASRPPEETACGARVAVVAVVAVVALGAIYSAFRGLPSLASSRRGKKENSAVLSKQVRTHGMARPRAGRLLNCGKEPQYK